jgi:RHS repeat-associated protein
MAKLNPIRFSTQYHDDYTGDDKYLFRDLRDGRWLGRDPIEEKGGKNLYEFVQNDALNRYDNRGLITFEGCIAEQQEDIKKSFKEGCDQVAGKYWGCCMNDSVIRYEVRERCKNDNLHVVCVQKETYWNQCEKRCAFTYPGTGSSTVYLCPGFDVPGDCGTKCTLVHEMVHLANAFPSSYGEKASEKAEICLGCFEKSKRWPNGLSDVEKRRISNCLCW